jgi:hypothetical protein
MVRRTDTHETVGPVTQMTDRLKPVTQEECYGAGVQPLNLKTAVDQSLEQRSS